MSCSLCRLPFVPSPMSAAPLAEHLPPDDFFTRAQYIYLQSAVGFGTRVHGLCRPFEFTSPNMFSNFDPPLALTVVWTVPNFTYVMMHRVCASLFRRAMHCEGDDFLAFKILSEVENVMGPLGELGDAGELRGVDYANIGEKIDVRPFWRLGNDHGRNWFDYEDFQKSPLNDWLFTRPDTMPRFFPKVENKHIGTIPNPDELPSRDDPLTTQPLDILRLIVANLDAPSYVRLTGTCRFLRAHALTTFQPEARRLVLALQWALPTSSELAKMTATEESSPHDGDWLLYLSHAHRTKGMRVRRWIWAAACEAARVFEERKRVSPYAEGKNTVERRKFDRQASNMYLPPMPTSDTGLERFSDVGN
ncbi:hypothetical protein BD626DRAFT_494511 [Schizophyllum amplum]|uniref:F-box domain-containing protein n=1 Tax=Schizophyllum amplum TaxID=97359 RepID=A0A550CFB6_9AGAR|nr:hypothetical protein BD626DRAFT_494511 [Auriculariopsis ampla]